MLLKLEKEEKFDEIKAIIDDPQYVDNPALSYYLAHCYFKGVIFEQDKDRCIEELRKSAALGYASACYELCLLFERNDGVDRDYKIANDYLIKAAEMDYLPAINHLGEITLMGRLDIAIDYEKAYSLFKKAADAGFNKANVNLAYCLLNGLGCKADPKKGLELLQEQADKKVPEALYNLGKAYYDGTAIKRDIIKATYYLLEASNRGHMFAAKLLGDCYYDGIGVAIDHKTAFKFYKRAADLGNQEAAELVAHCYVYGDGVPANFKEAMNYCVLSAQKGDKNAQVSLGNRYYKGDGFRRNYHRALYWYQEAAKQEDPYGLKNAADMFLVGEGCKKDVNRAIDYYLRAIKAYNYDAAYPLGEIYASGKKGLKKDYALAVKYYELAYLNNDDVDAAYAYAELVSKGKGVESPDYTKALRAYEFAANEGHLPSIKKTGEYYLKGIGVNKDYECALRYYLEAAKQGDEESAILVHLIRRSVEFN